ncbi:MAG: hypothetical protein KGM93_18410 [Sphingomonadales bacterium]|nr:hypothetical protein [Sphingomonadales bacterium]
MASIPCIAFVAEEEAAILADTVSPLLNRSLAAANLEFSVETASDVECVLAAGDGTIRIVSLLPFVVSPGGSWSEVESRLHEAFEHLAGSGDPIFILTVLRNVADRHLPASQEILLRIRRLNLLATELSRRFGAIVVDLDRHLADIGGRSLETDYRLHGARAAQVAGHEIALTIVSNGLDAFVPFEAQDEARTALEAERPAVQHSSALSPSDFIALGRGRNRQRVKINTDAVQEHHAYWLIKQLLNRRMSLREAVNRFNGAIQRRGLRESVHLLSVAIRQSIGRKHAT